VPLYAWAAGRYHSGRELVGSAAMTFTSSSLRSSLCRCSLPLVVAVASGCPADEEDENVLPTQADSDSGSDSSSASMTASMTATESMTGADGTADSTGAGADFPQAYRFECIDIQQLGDSDGTALQANILQQTWNNDIDAYKLNIVFEVATRDDAAGTATVGIRSGIGTNASDLCSEATSQSDIVDVGYDAAVTMWTQSDADGECSTAAAGGEASGGTYDMALPADTIVYIYAQDTDGTTFNCTADEALPDAVPVRAVEATLTVSADGQEVQGNLLGCLREDEAEALCSCLVMCNPEMENENCGGCPTGSIPLRTLLGDIEPSQRCTDLVGGNAFDIGIGFTAAVLPAVPTPCG
jgi:hypothetical protein